MGGGGGGKSSELSENKGSGPPKNVSVTPFYGHSPEGPRPFL